MRRPKFLTASCPIFFLLALAGYTAYAQVPIPKRPPTHVQLELDSTSATALLEALSQNKISDTELSRITSLPGTQAMIRQAARFDPTAKESAFVSSLRSTIESGKAEHDPFRFVLVKSRLELVRSLLKQISKDPNNFIESVASRIVEYAPNDVTLKSKVYLTVGGTSDGFAPTEDAFYLALHYFGDDYEGLKMMAAHELFHNVQAKLRRARGQREQSAQSQHIVSSLALLGNTMNEGTASMVGDGLLLPGGKSYSDFLKGKFKRNLERIKSNFALFELLLYRAYNDPSVEYSQLYSIGFSGTWDSPLYFVGYHMGKVIEKYKGKNAVKALIGAPPSQFFNEYVEIYNRQNGPEILRFSKSTEGILQNLNRVERPDAARLLTSDADEPTIQVNPPKTDRVRSLR